jgi:hypothetical protein
VIISSFSGQGIWHICRRRKVHTQFWWGNLREGYRCRLEDYIIMDFNEMGWECLDWIYLVHDRDKWPAIVNTVINL